MANQTTPAARYLSQYREATANGFSSSPQWLQQLRRSAIAEFERVGFPTARRGNEAWKYTNVSGLAAESFELPQEPEQRSVHGIDLKPFELPCPRVHHLVFVDGHYAADLSTEPPNEAGMHSETIGKRSEGLIVGRLAEGIGDGIPLVQEHLSRQAEAGSSAFTALNTAFVDDGALVYIPDGVYVPEPIYLLFVTTGKQRPSVTYPRVLIVAGANTKATVLLSFECVGPDAGVYFTDAVTEVVTGPGAALRLYKIQREGQSAYHIAATHASVGRDSTLSSVTLDLGGALVRHDQSVTLAAAGASVTLDGLYIGRGERHIDNHTSIDHAVAETTSGQVYKGILTDTSHGVFTGRVLVRKDSQRIDAHQMNKNLLLSDTAQIDTQPKLEIFADDVKCTHGAAVGRLDQAALFYLNSRGLGELEARELLVHGFVNEVLDSIDDDAIRQYADAAVAADLGELGGS
jgi:Fe-S cluster assembly protein SufD